MSKSKRVSRPQRGLLSAAIRLCSKVIGSEDQKRDNKTTTRGLYSGNRYLINITPRAMTRDDTRDIGN